MRVTGGLALAVAALLIIIAVINRAMFIAPVELSLGFTRVSASLGLILLGDCVAVSAVFVACLLKGQVKVPAANRELAVELRQHGELAETAESARGSFRHNPFA